MWTPKRLDYEKRWVVNVTTQTLKGRSHSGFRKGLVRLLFLRLSSKLIAQPQCVNTSSLTRESQHLFATLWRTRPFSGACRRGACRGADRRAASVFCDLMGCWSQTRRVGVKAASTGPSAISARPHVTASLTLHGRSLEKLGAHQFSCVTYHNVGKPEIAARVPASTSFLKRPASCGARHVTRNEGAWRLRRGCRRNAF